MPETRKPHFELKRQKERRHREVSEQDNKAQQRSRRHLARCSSLQLLHTPPEHTLTCSISLALPPGRQQYFNVILSRGEQKVKYVTLGFDRIANDCRRGQKKDTGPRSELVHDLISWVHQLWNWQAGLCYNMVRFTPSVLAGQFTPSCRCKIPDKRTPVIQYINKRHTKCFMRLSGSIVTSVIADWSSGFGAVEEEIWRNVCYITGDYVFLNKCNI